MAQYWTARNSAIPVSQGEQARAFPNVRLSSQHGVPSNSDWDRSKSLDWKLLSEKWKSIKEARLFLWGHISHPRQSCRIRRQRTLHWKEIPLNTTIQLILCLFYTLLTVLTITVSGAVLFFLFFFFCWFKFSWSEHAFTLRHGGQPEIMFHVKDERI